MEDKKITYIMPTYDEYKRRNQQIINQLEGLKRKKRELKRQQLLLQKERNEQKSKEIDTQFQKDLKESMDKWETELFASIEQDNQKKRQNPLTIH